MTIEGLPHLKVIHAAMQSSVAYHSNCAENWKRSIPYGGDSGIKMLEYHEEQKRIATEIAERCIIEIDRITFRKS